MEGKFEYKEPETNWRGCSCDGEEFEVDGKETKTNRLVLQKDDWEVPDLMITQDNFKELLQTVDYLKETVGRMVEDRNQMRRRIQVLENEKLAEQVDQRNKQFTEFVKKNEKVSQDNQRNNTKVRRSKRLAKK